MTKFMLLNGKGGELIRDGFRTRPSTCGHAPVLNEETLMRFILPILLTFLLTGLPALAQVGDLIWAEEFEDLDDWLILTGNGSWGWGNGELQCYGASNVDIAEIPGESGNTALRITARQESGPGIVDQWGNALSYTSGRVSSRSFVTVEHGMIETRVRVPDLDLGGWPAVWLLGDANYAWPRCGEMDMMEMGAKTSFRDLHDTHNGGDGSNTSTVNDVAGANAIFYADSAVTPENPSGAASLSWDPDDDDCRPYYDQVDGLVERFLIYRLYWDDAHLRYTVVDDGVESDLYESPFEIDETSDEFLAPFHMIVNLAIGGGFTDAYSLGDPGSGAAVSMPFPAEMYVDYIRIYEWNGMGEVHLGPPVAQGGTFGLYTEETPVGGSLEPEVTSQIYVWEGTLTDGALEPYEGEDVLSWRSVGLGWFGAGIMSVQPLNLFGFGDGTLEFMIKIPAGVTFKIGIIDSWGNQSYVRFPANQTTYGLTRNGEWGRATIPVSDIRGTAIDLRMLSYPFVILEESGTACEFALDDIYWSGGEETAVEDGGSAPAARIALHPNAPNPFNARTEIRFELPEAGPYLLTVHDLLGRRVARFEGLGVAGLNGLLWDGCDERGAPLGSGTYPYRLKTNAGTATGRMQLVK